MNKHVHILYGDYSYIVVDLINCFQASLQDLGYTTSNGTSIHETGINLNIGATNVSYDEFVSCQDRLIHYNLEQVHKDNYLLNNDWANLLKVGVVWDYSQQNINRFSAMGIYKTAFVPIGFHKAMSFIESSDEQDIDVLFYGVETDRRTVLINNIRDRGLTVLTPNLKFWYNQPWPVEERNKAIQRSKVVLNAHAYDQNNIFELVRVSHLLANKKAVVSEVRPDTYIEQDLVPAIMHGSINQLPALCEMLVYDDECRKEQEKIGFDIFSKRNQLEYLYNGLGAYYRYNNFQT